MALPIEGDKTVAQETQEYIASIILRTAEKGSLTETGSPKPEEKRNAKKAKLSSAKETKPQSAPLASNQNFRISVASHDGQRIVREKKLAKEGMSEAKLKELPKEIRDMMTQIGGKATVIIAYQSTREEQDKLAKLMHHLVIKSLNASS